MLLLHTSKIISCVNSWQFRTGLWTEGSADTVIQSKWGTLDFGGAEFIVLASSDNTAEQQWPLKTQGASG